MTRIIYSMISLLMLTMGVVTFEHWGNRVSVPDDNLEDFREMSFFPSRKIRVSSRHSPCRCDVNIVKRDFGSQSYPRYLVDKPCLHQECIRNRTCEEVRYTFNITEFVETDEFLSYKSDARPVSCVSKENSRTETISTACIPIYATRQE